MKNKIVVYDPTKLQKSVPAYYNEILTDVYENSTDIDTITFAQQDLLLNLKDKNEFIKAYLNFIQEWDLPFAFFPYYGHFARALYESMNIPNPKLEIKLSDNEKINVVVQPTYGFLVVNVKKFKDINFKFNEEFTEIYYLQDMVQKMYEAKLWISNCSFIDIFESWNYLKDQAANYYLIDMQKYQKESEKYEAKELVDLNKFLELLKEYVTKIKGEQK